MFVDKQNLYSEDQAITATAVSENAIDHGAGGAGAGSPLPLFAVVTEDFDNLTDLTIALQESSDDGDSDSYADKMVSPAIPLASLTAGTMIFLGTIPPDTERYTKLNYTVNGTEPTAGKITAGIALDLQSNGLV